MKFFHVSLLLPLLIACETPTEPSVPRLPTPPAEDRPVVITGRIVNAGVAVGLQGANIRVLEASASVGTGEAGHYRIVLPASFRGRVIPVNARAIGFYAQSKTVALNSDSVAVDFVMRVHLSCSMGVTGITTEGKGR